MSGSLLSLSALLDACMSGRFLELSAILDIFSGAWLARKKQTGSVLLASVLLTSVLLTPLPSCVQ